MIRRLKTILGWMIVFFIMFALLNAQAAHQILFSMIDHLKYLVFGNHVPHPGIKFHK